jgi:hypothetical protein
LEDRTGSPDGPGRHPGDPGRGRVVRSTGVAVERTIKKEGPHQCTETEVLGKGKEREGRGVETPHTAEVAAEYVRSLNEGMGAKGGKGWKGKALLR